jgi:DNA-binding response OmpR family regulator
MSKHATILVVDDTEDILDALNIVLSSEGYIVETTPNEAYINDLIAEKRSLPNLIMLDVLLSGQDGRMLAKKLKANPKTQHIPIIMMSAHPNVAASIKECGADDFLPKPFELNDLLLKIAKHTKKKK